jgi:hypothetical protein
MTEATSAAGDFADFLQAQTGQPPAEPPAPPVSRLPAPNPAQGSGGGRPIVDPATASAAAAEAFGDELVERLQHSRAHRATNGPGGWRNATDPTTY